MSKRCTPYTKTNTLTPQYEYTNEMAKEDYRIANYCVYKKYTSIFPEKSITKNDLVQWCVMQLWHARPLYDKSKGKYITYAVQVCKRVIFNQSIVKRQYEDLECGSIDHEYTDENGNIFTLMEVLGKTDKEPVNDLIKIIYKAVDSIASPIYQTKAKQIVELFLSGKIENYTQAGKVMGCSREYVRQLIARVRFNALQISNTGTCQKVKNRKRGRPLGCVDKTPRRLKQTVDNLPEVNLDTMTFSQLRIAKGFTLAQIAKQIGVDTSSVGYWCRKCWLPKPDKIEKLAQIFNCTFDQMQAIILR